MVRTKAGCAVRTRREPNGLVRGARRYQPGFDLEQREGTPTNLNLRRSRNSGSTVWPFSASG